MDDISSTSTASSKEVEAATPGKLEATTAAMKIVPTITASTDAITCDFNDTSCVTATKGVDSTVVTTATTLRKATTLTTSKLTTTSKPTTTKSVTTSAPTIPKVDIEIFKDFSTDICTCNLQRHFCDINCCCDRDCSFEDKMVFKACKRETNLHRDTSFCQYMDYIYLNNTPYKWEINQNGLFCIAKSNLPTRYTMQNKEPITTLEDAQLQKRNKHSWPDTEDKQTYKLHFNTTENFMFGVNIWIIRNHSLELFQLPDNFITSACLIKKDMKFLQNYRTKCSQTWINKNNPSLQPETYFKNISVIRAPRYFNVSLFRKNFENCHKNVCLPIEAKICDENYENCIDVSSSYQLLASCHLNISTNENFCVNLTQKVKYNFYHNGTQGLTKIDLFLTLNNISFNLGKENFEFSQQFEVSYLWFNYSFDYSALMSGNPGYLISKPVLIGNIISASNATNSTKSSKMKIVEGLRIKRNSLDVSDNFLVLPANKKGVCTLSNQTYVAVEFGYNMILKCKLERSLELQSNLTASNTCSLVQQKIFDYWPISRTNLTDLGKVVGNFGNANASVLADWTKIVSNKSPRQILNQTAGNFTRQNTTLLCRNIVSSLKIDIFHARVDFKNLRDQEKILGAAYHFGDGKDFEFSLDENHRLSFEVVVREEVMFFDVTSERIQKFVDPPSFRITLPYDFFYPFVKIGNGGNDVVICNVLLLMSVGLLGRNLKFPEYM